MFESAEVGHAVDKKAFRKEQATLRERLLEAQRRLLEQARFPVLLLISGVDGAGKSETNARSPASRSRNRKGDRKDVARVATAS